MSMPSSFARKPPRNILAERCGAVLGAVKFFADEAAKRRHTGVFRGFAAKYSENFTAQNRFVLIAAHPIVTIILYLLYPVKVIVGVFLIIPVAVGKLFELAVIRAVSISRKRIRTGFDF